MTTYPVVDAELLVRVTRKLAGSTLRALVLIDRVAVQAGDAQHSLGDRARGLVPVPRRPDHER